jgi:ribonuclease HII
MVKADAHVPAVSAASLVAKAYRDALMQDLHATYPHFGWDANAGYGTPAHLAALRLHGPSPLHRMVFVATALSGGQKARKGARAVQMMLDPGQIPHG